MWACASWICLSRKIRLASCYFFIFVINEITINEMLIPINPSPMTQFSEKTSVKLNVKIPAVNKIPIMM